MARHVHITCQARRAQLDMYMLEVTPSYTAFLRRYICPKQHTDANDAQHRFVSETQLK